MSDAAPSLRVPSLAVLLLATHIGCGLDLGSAEWTPPIGPAETAPIAPREPCAHRDPLRKPFFGDLHVHTGFSMDANAQGTETSPDDAYRFARGEEIAVFSGEPGVERTAQLERPLDFTAVTDHAEWLGEVHLCRTPGSEVYDTRSCQIFRGEAVGLLSRLLGRTEGFFPRLLGLIDLDQSRADEVCGDDDAICRRGIASAWAELQASAERFYDRTGDCTFTTFHAWEYSRSSERTKIHRNVILRNELSPEFPISWIDTPHERGLWPKLRDLCNETGTGCEAIAIPHNPNLSNGRMFEVWYREEGEEQQRAEAALRAEIEPLVEMTQIKGDSECRNGMFEVLGDVDELCDYEKIRDMGDPALEDCGEGASNGAQDAKGCTSRVDFVRYALLEGVREAKRIGVNPFRFGFIGSTDTHTSTPGQVSEWEQPFKFGATERRVLTVNGAKRATAFWSPGGLAGIWAEENSRDAIFDGMKRREAFATSGPRIAPRFFAGWDLPADLCARNDFVETGYRDGVPMGRELPAPSDASGGPVFAVSSLRDPGTAAQPGGLLQRIQIVKGWVDDEGFFHQKVIDVAGDADNGASVDLDTCTPQGPGAEQLCGVWQDPDYDPSREAVYYARTVENPSCRWTTRLCNAWTDGEKPDGCSHPTIPKTIQERAWTSPVWVTPAG